MNHPFPYWLWTSHQSSLGSNQQTSFTFLWANTCLPDQATFLFFKDLSFAVILVISRPLSNHSIEKNRLSLSPTAALLCWINRLQGYSIDQKDAWRHDHPTTKPVQDRSVMNHPPSSAENSTCGTLGSHSCCSSLTFFVQGSLRKQYRSDGSLQTVCDGMSEAIKEISGGFKRQPKSGQGGISSGPNDMDTLWRASSKPDRNASLAVWIPCGFKGSPWGDVLSVG